MSKPTAMLDRVHHRAYEVVRVRVKNSVKKSMWRRVWNHVWNRMSDRVWALVGIPVEEKIFKRNRR